MTAQFLARPKIPSGQLGYAIHTFPLSFLGRKWSRIASVGWPMPTDLSWRTIGQSTMNPSRPSCQFDYENQHFYAPISDRGNTVKLHLWFWSDMILDYDRQRET